MGLLNHECDSCNQETDVLFPLAILKELPTGGEQLVQVWYCVECWNIIHEGMELTDNDEGEEEPEEEDSEPIIRRYNCGCMFKKIGESARRGILWSPEIVCDEHWLTLNTMREVYPCGCVIKHVILFFYEYERACEDHIKNI